MAYRAADCHNMMEWTLFRVEDLKFWTFVFQFLDLVIVTTCHFSTASAAVNGCKTMNYARLG